MGYRTFHTLTVYDAVMIDGNPATLSLGNEVSDEIAGTLQDEIVEELDASFEEEIKWYDCESEMSEFSKKYPQYVFKIHGDGEDQTDMWDAYFHNGRYQNCQAVITYPPFNAAKFVE